MAFLLICVLLFILQAEGIFRITAENSHEEHVRDQLNKGIVPVDIDVHCLAGLIKVWLSFLFKFSFRFIFCNFAVGIQTQEASRDEDEAFIASLHS
jgi:hypothetical protein